MHEYGSGHGVEVAQWKAHVARAYEAHAQRITDALSKAFGRWIAEDAVQEAFARALTWKPTAKRLENMLSLKFMRCCSARVAIRILRTSARHRCRERRRARADGSSCLRSRAPDMLLEAKERERLAVDVFSELPSWQRPIVYMMLVDRRTKRDIERITAVRSTTQANWRHRFVTELRHRLDPQD
jgi:DNA-directed RNA polymerase specialized sigma24 family protein